MTSQYVKYGNGNRNVYSTKKLENLSKDVFHSDTSNRLSILQSNGKTNAMNLYFVYCNYAGGLQKR
jgi:hypothetical protein